MEHLLNLNDQLRNEQHTKDMETQSGLDTSNTDSRIASLIQQIAEVENKLEHEGRVQEATTEITTYFDTLYVGGQTMRELCSDEEAYQILRLSVSQAFIDQATKNSEVLSKVQADSQAAIKQEKERADELDNQNGILLLEKHTLKNELDDITSRFKAAELLLSEAPSSEETDKLKQEITDLKAQLELKAKAEAPKGDAKSQIDAMVQERENKKRKVTNLRLADPSGINTKDYLATDVLTGEELEIHSNYIRSYKEVSVEEAEQIRADEANKKAEQEALQAAIPTIEAPEVQPVNAVLETVEAVQQIPFQEEVQTADNGDLQGDQGNESLHEVVSEESEITYITQRELAGALNLVYNTIRDVSSRVSDLELGKQAVA